MPQIKQYTQTNVRLPVPTARALKKRAVEDGKSLVQLIRELSEQYLASGILFSKEMRKRDVIWNLPNRAVKTGQSNLAGRIDSILYGGKSPRRSR